MNDYEFGVEVAKYISARSEEKKALERKEAIGKIIKDEMTNHGLTQRWVALSDREVKVSYKYYTQNRFDRKAFEAEHPDLLARFMKECRIRQLIIE